MPRGEGERRAGKAEPLAGGAKTEGEETMPEQISKYPDVTLKILKEAGAACGEGAPQKILTACPPERFCSLPTGEICIYGLADVPKMTQVTGQELVAAAGGGKSDAGGGLLQFALPGLGAAFVAGLLLGRFWRSRGGGSEVPPSEPRHPS